MAVSKVPNIPLTVLAAILWLLGWLAGKVAGAFVWMWFAIKVGWIDARSPRKH